MIGAVVLTKMRCSLSAGKDSIKFTSVVGDTARFSKNTMDVYENFHIYYTEDNKVDAIEIFGSEGYFG